MSAFRAIEMVGSLIIAAPEQACGVADTQHLARGTMRPRDTASER